MCQRASDVYQINAFSNASATWGSAPNYVRSWWRTHGCRTAPHRQSACQRLSDVFGIANGQTWGVAPPNMQQLYQSWNCVTYPVTNQAAQCQNASNLYAMGPAGNWGGASANVESWYALARCTTTPQCQGISELYGTGANGSFGGAPEYVKSWWNANHCSTAPLFQPNVCQLLADNFGITFGLSDATVLFDPNLQTYWENNCAGGAPSYHPRSRFSENGMTSSTA